MIDSVKSGFEQANDHAVTMTATMKEFTKRQDEISARHLAAVEQLEKLAGSVHKWVTDSRTTPTATDRDNTTYAPQQNVPQINEKIAKASKLTYAQALAESSIAHASIRNIEIVGNTEEEKLNTVLQLKKDDALATYDIHEIKQKGATQFVFKCANEETAIKVAEQLVTKYRDSIKITLASKKLPQIKLIRINSSSTSPDELKLQLRTQNAILRDAEFQVISIYEVKAPRGSYNNAIIQCDLELHSKLIERRTLILGFSEVRVFEHVETLQCSKCLSYGHLAGSCKGTTHCRRCAGEHLAVACPTPTIVACINCILSNKRGTKYNTTHSPVDARCPIRKDRIAGLKLYHTQKN